MQLTLLGVLLVKGVYGNVIGIDLGTEAMKIALVQPGAPLEIVTNHFSKRKTETVVAFVRGERFFGGDAYGMLSRKPTESYARFSPLLGASSDVDAKALLAKSYMPMKIVFNETRGGLGIAVGDKELTIEELVAMILGYAKDITRAYGGQSIKDCVITVPSHATQQTREAVIRAAELAELRVLSLIDENTAAALQFGLDRIFNEKRLVLFYNLGSEYAQASLVEYSAFQDKSAKNKSVGQLEIRGKGWALEAGGYHLDLALTELLATAFEKQFPETVKNQKLRTLPRPMAKIRAAAKKVKEVLSANAEIPVHIPSLHEDRDFSTTLTRADLEKASNDVFAKLTGPIDAAISMANVSYDDIDAIEIIGGGVRVPKVQEILRDFLSAHRANDAPALELGLHLNGDEAMSLGAAFHGANVSTSFRVRKVGLVDISPFSVGVKLSSSADESWAKTTNLFKRGAKYGGKAKTIAFQHDADVVCEILYEDDSMGSIALYNITGVAQFAADMRANIPDAKPKVQLSFALDASGLTTISKAEVSLQLEEDDNTTNGAEIYNNTPNTESETTSIQNSSEDTTEINETNKESANNISQDINATQNTNNNETVTPIKKPKILKRSLQIHTLRSGSRTWSSILADAAESKQRLIEAKIADEHRAKLAEARNNLEAAIYATRGAVNEREEELSIVSIQEERDSIRANAEELEEWLYEANDQTPISEFVEKRSKLVDALALLDFRLSERAKRPAALSAARKALATARANATTLWPQEKPWLSTDDLDDLLSKITKVEQWLDDVESQQSQLPPTADPYFKVADIAPKLKPVAALAAKLAAKPKPIPPKTNETVSINATDNSTNSTVNATRNYPEEDASTDPESWDEL